MIKRIYLEFRPAVYLQIGKNVLPVSLTIYDERGRLEGKNSYLSVMPNQLYHSFQNWRKYVSLTSQDSIVRRIRFEPKIQKNSTINDSNVNFEQIANEFKADLNQWLEKGWFNEHGERDIIIQKTLESYCIAREETQFFIQTDNKELRGLAWQEWAVLQNFFATHPHTELSISSTNFKRPQRTEILLTDARIRILAIFGDEKLDLTEEKYLITNLSKYGGIIHVLNQPSKAILEQALQNPKGWHILFFAGHSSSNEHGNLGWIENKPGEKIAIDNLSNSIQKLIQDKLQLVIFNSCDGLGLANQLVSLSLSYCIVMREPVESAFARELLRSLLSAFVQGKSLFAAMRCTREYLRQEFDEKGKHPGKSWLPVIVANPEAQLLTWDGMFTERRLERKWELLLFALILIATIGLPISIWIEFGDLNTLIFYAQLYPQVVIYPSLLLGISLYALYRSICLIRQKAKIFWSFTVAVFIFSCVSVSLDINSDPLMLFELKPHAVAVIKSPILLEVAQEQKISDFDLKAIPKNILNTERILDSQSGLEIEKKQLEESIRQHLQFRNEFDQNYHNSVKILLKNKIWNNTTNNQYSISRYFYTFSYFSTFVCAAQIFTLIFQSLLAPTTVFNQNKYISYLIICEIGILFWLIFYSYYIQTVKPFLLGLQFNPHFANLTPLIYIFMSSLSFLTLWLIRLQVDTYKYRQIFSAVVIFVLMLTVVMSVGGVSVIDRVYGIGSDSTLTAWGGTIGIFYFLYFIIIVSLNFKEMRS